MTGIKCEVSQDIKSQVLPAKKVNNPTWGCLLGADMLGQRSREQCREARLTSLLCIAVFHFAFKSKDLALFYPDTVKLSM